jgi:hypothetical protein
MPIKSSVVREPIGTWWKIKRYDVKIEPVKVVAFTAAFVTYLETPWCFSGPKKLQETRERRDDIFQTFAEAKAEAVRRAAAEVESCKKELQRLRSALGNWESLEEPK